MLEAPSGRWRQSLREILAFLVADLGLFAAGRGFGLEVGAAQIASFGLAALLYVLLRIRGFPRPLPGSLFGRIGLVAAMGFFLRSGVLATLTRACAWSPRAAILPAILVSLFTLLLGWRKFVAPEEISADRRMMWIAGFLVALRVVFLPSVELLPEEAYYWNYAQHPALGYLDHPPMVAWLIAAGTFLFGHNSAGVRMGAVLCWAVVAWCVFRIARRFFGRAVAVRTMLLLALLPAFFGIGFFMTPDAPLAACWAGALYFFSRVFFGCSTWSWLGAGACIGLGMDSKYTIALTGAAALLFLLLDKPSRHWLLHPAPYLGAILSGMLFSPVIFWNSQNQWASFVFQGPRRWAMAPPVFGP